MVNSTPKIGFSFAKCAGTITIKPKKSELQWQKYTFQISASLSWVGYVPNLLFIKAIQLDKSFLKILLQESWNFQTRENWITGRKRSCEQCMLGFLWKYREEKSVKKLKKPPHNQV